MSDQERISLSSPQNQPMTPVPGTSAYVPPTDLVSLPSKGKVYPIDSALFSLDKVEIRSMTARDEDILSSRALIRSGRAINTLLQACVMTAGVDVEKMVAGDRNALMVAVRITGYGAEYKAEVTCQNDECGQQFKYSFDLSKMALKPLGAEPTSPGSNLFTFVLPVTNRTCLFKLLTGADERDMATAMERQKKLLGPNAGDSSVTTRLAYQLVQIGDEKDPAKIRQLVTSMPAGDSLRLRNYIDSISPGIIMAQDVECPHCGDQREVPVPFGTEFFWPQS